ncbi:hypothetical protein NE619_07160 [Anaerovorax odorimutans]|uniref:Uncharacterized protein n=1 Tax=Anaerovorax odorimutans TaxID=109327 RepID=A0ABT1RMU6_9FIRM|nr:hypothetical protein [Anaerovorax odorimutans]
MKKDPLLPFLFDESSGNDLIHYYAKVRRRFFPTERGPEATESSEWFGICDQIPVLSENPATIVPKKASWSQAG